MPNTESLAFSAWHLAAVGALVVALVYLFVWPKSKGVALIDGRRPVVHFILRWGHALVWLCLAAFFVVRGGQAGVPVWLGAMFGVLAATLCLVLLAVLLHERKRG